MLSQAFLDEVRNRTSLSTLIGRSVKLVRAGNEHKACCPFHNEKSPSFYVNDDKGFYHCFGCSAHGDAIRWLTDAQGMPFMDAVKELAQAAGMEVPALDPQGRERAERANGLHDVVAFAQNWFVQQLQGIEGAEARAYLERRGIGAATAKKFGFGFAPDARGKLKSALSAFEDGMRVEAGLLIRPDDGRDSYDRFRGRLMIPIADQRGRTIAFGGRLIGPGEPKYLNSPETPLFDKGRTLFNLDRAAPASRAAGRIIVVEGYLDVVALDQAGISEVVAPLGTALTEAQLERLWRLSDVPILCFDGDAAGQKAAVRAALRALSVLEPGKSLSFAILPQGQDPDDLVRSGGAEAFKAVIAAAVPLGELIWRHEEGAHALTSPEARAGLRQRLDALASGNANKLIAEEYRRYFRDMFYEHYGWKPRDMRDMRQHVEQEERSRLERPITRDSQMMGYVRSVLLGVMKRPYVIRDIHEPLSAIPIADENLKDWRDLLINAVVTRPDLDVDGFVAIFDGEGVHGTRQRCWSRELRWTFLKPGEDDYLAAAQLKALVERLRDESEIEVELAELDRQAREINERGSGDDAREDYERVRAQLNRVQKYRDELLNEVIPGLNEENNFRLAA